MSVDERQVLKNRNTWGKSQHCPVPAVPHRLRHRTSPRYTFMEHSPNDPTARSEAPGACKVPASQPPRASAPSAAGLGPSPGGSTAAPLPPRGPAAPSRPPRGGEPSAGAARRRPRGSGDDGRAAAAAAPPRPRGVEHLSAAPVGTAAAGGGGGGVCLRRQRGPSAAPLRPPAPSHAVVMEEPRWRPWPTRGASERSTTTSA